MPNIGKPGKPTDSGEMAPNTFGLLRAYLAQVKNKDGSVRYSQEWIEKAIGGNPGGRSKLNIVEDLKNALSPTA